MNIDFSWIGGATFVIETEGLRIASDPALAPKGSVTDFFWFKSVRLNNPVYDDKTFKNIDIWLLTHTHLDHLDEMGLTEISAESIKIGTKDVARYFAKKNGQDIEILKWNESRTFTAGHLTIEVTAVPALHGINPLSAFFAGKVNGYLLKINNGDTEFTTYVTGDTIYKKHIFRHIRFPKIDLMVPNMGAAKKGSWIMNLTLDAGMLARFIARINPGVVIPVHFETFSHYKEPIKKTAELNNPRIKIMKPGEKMSFKLRITQKTAPPL